MEWPKITHDFTARNGYTIRPISSMQDALAHGRQMSNGLEVPGIYHEIAASGGNVIFAVFDPEDRLVGSGSLKSGNQGVAFVNFLRGHRNVEFPSTSPAVAASEEWTQAINDRSIPLAAVPTTSGLFEKVEANAPAQHNEPDGNQSFVNRAMTAFMNIMRHSRLHAPGPAAEPNAQAQADAEGPQSAGFTPREVPQGAWSVIASPGAPNPETGLSVVPATDAAMLRYIVEQCECRMMWEFNSARRAIEEGVVQVAGIMDSDPNNPLIGYAILGVRDGRVVPTQITGRFDHRPTPAMISTVSAWTEAVNALEPGAISPSGISRNIGIDGARFMVENYERGTEPHYNDFGQLVEQGRNRDYSPGLAISDIRSGSVGAILPPQLDEIPVRCTDMPTLTNIETLIPGLRFKNIDAATYPAEIDLSEVVAGRAVPFKVSAPIFGIIEEQPVREPEAPQHQDRQDNLRNEEDRMIRHIASADGLNETDKNGNGVPDNEEGWSPADSLDNDTFAEPPSIMGLLRRAENGSTTVSIIPNEDATNADMIRSLQSVVENVAAMSRTLVSEMELATKPVLAVAEKFYPEAIPVAPRPQPNVTPAAPEPPRPAGPGNGPGF